MVNISINSTKSLIITALGDRFPLTLKQIHNEIKKNRKISYQAVHKVIKELIKEQIVEKIEKQYFLNKEWIKQQTKSFSKYHFNYFNLNYNPNQISKESKIQIFKFSSIKEIGDFIIDAYAKGYFDTEEKKIYFLVRRILPFFPPSLISFAKKILKQNDIYVLCRSNTIADKWAAKLYRKLGIKIKLGATTPHYNSVCIGDYVIQYFNFINEDYRKKIYSFSEKINKKPPQSLLKLTSDVLYKRTELYLIINRHPVLVNDIKQNIVKEF